MPSYCAFLGHQPSVSLAELLSALPPIGSKVMWNKHVLTFSTREEVPASLLSLLGGTVLLAEEIDIGKGDLLRTIPEAIYAFRTKSGEKGKVTFSLRTVGVERGVIRALYRAAKSSLRSRSIPSRYVGSEREPLAPGVLAHHGIPGTLGCEIVILQQNRQRWIGRTIAAQDIRAYRERDIGKPSRDMRTGLLPPKLAQILLNLGSYLVAHSAAKGKHPLPLTKRSALSVWDPFAGSGVIPIECMIRRWNVLASDVSLRTLKRCEENIAWYREHARVPKNLRVEILRADARKADPPSHVPDCVVTETSLGPPMTSPLPARSIPKALREAADLELGFLKRFREICPTVPIVCTFPVYADREGVPHPILGIGAAIEHLGYRFVLPKDAQPWTKDRSTLLYLRRDQWVGREIVCLLPSSPPKKQR